MFTIFTGDDVTRAKAEAQKRTKGRELVRIGEGGESLESLGGYLEQSGLFAPQVAVIADRSLDTADGKEFIVERAEAIAESSALVILIQPELDAVTKKKLEKFATVEVFTLPERAAAVEPNSFALVDALQAGDRKRAWILYRNLINAGASAEEVHGTLAWAARGIVLAGNTRSADEAGMKPFPYGKAKEVARRLKPGEAVAQSAELVRLYHDARMGRGTLEDLLEIYLLKK